MPIKNFVAMPSGELAEITDNNVGSVQTCQVCGAVLAKQETDQRITVDNPRYMGTIKIAALLPPETPGTQGHIHQADHGFELCHPCAEQIFAPLGFVKPLAAADAGEHQGAAAAELGADVGEQGAGYRMTAILGADGRDSGYTLVETEGQPARYIDGSGADVDADTVHAATEPGADVAERPVDFAGIGALPGTKAL